MYAAIRPAANEPVKEFGIARFLTLRQAQDEEMDGIFTSC
jgi:hypothetical protein